MALLKNMTRNILTFLILLTSLTSFGHAFHVALAKASYNAGEKTMEVTLEIESHDLEHWLEDKGMKIGHIEMIEKNTPTWHKLTGEILVHFAAQTDSQKLQFSVLGIEVARDGRAFVYLVAENVVPFKRIDWTFSLLMDHDDTQQNKLELIVNKKKYYAVFLNEKRTATIKLD